MTQMVKNPSNEGDLGLIPGLGRSSGGRYGNPLQYTCLENPHGQRSLVGYSPWGHNKSDMAERLTHTQGARCSPLVPVNLILFRYKLLADIAR